MFNISKTTVNLGEQLTLLLLVFIIGVQKEEFIWKTIAQYQGFPSRRGWGKVLVAKIFTHGKMAMGYHE